MADYISLSTYGIRFKHLISGPAPVGRILNYLIRTGNGNLRHKNGYRKVDLVNQKACAWCSEFMVGLGLVTYNDLAPQPVILQLTEKGTELFDLIKNSGLIFDEDIDPSLCRRQLIHYSPTAYETFKNIFLMSPVYLNLTIFVENKGTKTFDKGKSFNKLYWKTFLDEYSDSDEFDPDARTTAGDNRVPSLIQICQFFGMCTTRSGKYHFDLPCGIPEKIEVAFDQRDPGDAERVIDLIEDFRESCAIRAASTYSDEEMAASEAKELEEPSGGSRNKRYPTDPRLSKTVLAKAEWKCELSGKDDRDHTTFDSASGNKYVEAHHLVPMKAQKRFAPTKLDIACNIVPLCPNCHRAVHFGTQEEKRKILEPLFELKKDDLAEKGIVISLEELINKYY